MRTLLDDAYLRFFLAPALLVSDRESFISQCSAATNLVASGLETSETAVLLVPSPPYIVQPDPYPNPDSRSCGWIPSPLRERGAVSILSRDYITLLSLTLYEYV